jgi:hypothetical protein
MKVASGCMGKGRYLWAAARTASPTGTSGERRQPCWWGWQERLRRLAPAGRRRLPCRWEWPGQGEAVQEGRASPGGAVLGTRGRCQWGKRRRGGSVTGGRGEEGRGGGRSTG